MNRILPSRRQQIPAAGGPVRRRFSHCLGAALAVCPAAFPASAQVLVGDGTITCGTPYVVASGDTLSRISGRVYGDPQLYGFLADANWDALGGNPENIAVGMSLAVPCVDAAGKTLTPEQATAERAEAAASLQQVVGIEGTLTPDELDTLFGPVALFPDKVLTPLLVATTFPLDVVKAARFVDETSGLSDKERSDQAANQDWDSSVRELAAGFPTVIKRMNDNIDWTEQAGEAVVAQTDEVLAAVQRLRGKAQANGYLADNEAQKVEEENDKIVIASANPDVVYVPTYDSQVVYSTPATATPAVYQYTTTDPYDDSYNWNDALVAGSIIFGSAVVLDEIFDDDDWDGWDIDDDIDWDRGDITINRGDINIDRDRIDIGGGEGLNIGDGERGAIGDAARAGLAGAAGAGLAGAAGRSISRSDRTQVDREALTGARDRVAAGNRPRAAALQDGHKPISTAASRDAARQKIEARKGTGAQPARMHPTRAQTARGKAAATKVRATPKATNRAAHVSRSNVQRAPKVRASASHSSSFKRTSGGGRAHVSSSRGHRSMGGHGGGMRAGGGRGGGGRGGGRR